LPDLTHIGCTGSVVLDVVNQFRLVAPTFSISTTGISNLVLDVEILPIEETIPKFFCRKCKMEFTEEVLSSSIGALCRICGLVHPVDKLVFHSRIGILCIICIKKLKLATERKEETYIKRLGKVYYEYVAQYELSKSLRTRPLATILKIPINIL
jgi:hypothetical protein